MRRSPRAFDTPARRCGGAPRAPRRWIDASGPGVCIAAAAILLQGCDSREPRRARPNGDSIVVVDAAGERLVLSRPATRIVSLVPSVTSTLYAMGASSTLIGRTDFDTQEWARALPSVGGGLEPSLEKIVALEPDLVVRFGGDQDPRTRDRLVELGIPCLTVRPDRLQDLYDTAQLLGRVTDHEAQADSLVDALRTGLEQTADAVRSWPRVRVAHVIGGSPPWVTGGGTYIDEILSLVGADNVFSDLGTLYAAVSPEELRTREIDVVLVSSLGHYDETLTPGARLVDIGSSLEIPGPDVVHAAREVAEAIHARFLR
jgi:iron complex transport system substrate-binding protein